MAFILLNPFFWAALLLALVLLIWLGIQTRITWRPAIPLRLLLFIPLIAYFLVPKDTVVRPFSQPQREVLLADLSESIPHEAKEKTSTYAQEWLGGSANRIVLGFAGDTGLLLPGQDWASINNSTTNLPNGLEAARSLFYGETKGRLILLSDGVFPDPLKALEELRTLAEEGIQIDVLPLPTKQAEPGDLWVDTLSLPSYLWEDGEFRASLPVHVNQEGYASIQLVVNRKEVAYQVEELQPGEQVIALTGSAPIRGTALISVNVSWKGDPFPNNNTAYATAHVFPAPGVLYVTNTIGGDTPLSRQLASAGIEVAIAAPQDFPVAMGALEECDVIFLDNLIAENLSAEQVKTLQMFVSKWGRGVVFLGGRFTYNLGNFDGSLLEPMLPVRMEPPARSERDPLSLVLVLDTSSSMGTGAGGDRPIAMEREAALSILESLRPEDKVGILSYATRSTWNVPYSPLGEGLNYRTALDAISGIQARGNTFMYNAIDEVIDTLGSGGGYEPINVILLSDGKSTDGDDDGFARLAEQAGDLGISISTIGLGRSIDKETLEMIATISGGRSYHVPEVKDLPQVMVREMQNAQSENVQEGETGLQAGTASPILAGLDPNLFPPLHGYNAQRSKADEGAEDILVSASFQDPILSSWQYGLGRVLTWTGDAGQEFATEWSEWSQADEFWTQVLRYALPDPNLVPQPVNVHTTESAVLIDAFLEDARGNPLEFPEVFYQFSDIESNHYEGSLPLVVPGRYQAAHPLPEVGAYRGELRMEDGGSQRTIEFHFAVNPSHEDVPDQADSIEQMLQISADSGGREITWGDLEAAEPTNIEPAEKAKERGPDLALWLLVGVLTSWPLEILIRRRWLSWYS